MNKENDMSCFTEKKRHKILWGRADCVDLFALKEDILQKECFDFKAVSWCMFPVMQKGDHIKVENTDIRRIKAGDIPVYRSGGQLYAHRAIGRESVNGKEFIITRPDMAGDTGNTKGAERVPVENVLGKISRIRRGERSFSIEKRRAIVLDRFRYAKVMVLSRARTMFDHALLKILTFMQAQRLYRKLGRAIVSRLKNDISFKLVIPASKRLNIYSYRPLDKADVSELDGCGMFHIMIKLKDDPVGYATFLNSPEDSPRKGIRLSEVYLRLRYREIGFDEILLKRSMEFTEFKNSENIPKRNCTDRLLEEEILYNTEELILISARKDLNDELKDKAVDLIKEGIDWESFCKYALRGGLTVLIYGSLKEISGYTHIPGHVIDRLRPASIVIISRSVFQERRLVKILELFAAESIPVIPLKGMILAKRLYGDIAARGLGVDFDLLIKENDKERAFDLLKKADYTLSENIEADRYKWQYTFIKPEETIIDLHLDITLAGRSRDRIMGLWQGVRMVTDGKVNYYEFKEEELLLYLCAHLVSNDYCGSLRHISDINQLLYDDRLMMDWDSIIKKAKEWRLSSSLYVTLSMCKKLFNLPVSDEILDKIKPPLAKRAFIGIFANKKFILRPCKRKKFMNSYLGYVFFELVEAETFSEYFSIIFRRILFPPGDVLLSNKNYSSKPVFVGYILRLFRGIFNLFPIVKHEK